VKREPYTFDEIAVSFVQKAAGYASRRYKHWGVDRDDFAQEIACWLYGPGKAKVERWLVSDPQQSTRIYRSMLDVVIKYGEREKAERVGYHSDDVTWYTAAMVEAVLPLVLDSTYDSQSSTDVGGNGGKHKKLAPGEGANLLTSVMDVRRALKHCPTWVQEVLEDYSSGHPAWEDAIELVVHQLGGSLLPQIGRRRVMNNATAQHVTHQQEAS
jgi:hypothetical protein